MLNTLVHHMHRKMHMFSYTKDELDHSSTTIYFVGT